jgi:phosphatidate cytidylyltransferase
MLGQRILTALVLLAIFIPLVLTQSPLPFGWLAVVLLSTAMWEWSRLNGLSANVSLASGITFFVICSLTLVTVDLNVVPVVLWWATTLVWTGGGIWMLARGITHWGQLPKTLRWVLGFVLLYVAWLAVVRARMLGVPYLFSVLVLVWAADSGAYFAGKALGMRLFDRRLAPTISPGKTWEGVLGGWMLVLVVGTLWWHLSPSTPGETHLYTSLMQKGVVLWVVALAFLVALSVVGDLVESMVKRVAGVKDSSDLLPGHGGVLDRVDALLPTVPAALGLSLGLLL